MHPITPDFVIETDLDPEAVRARLEPLQPWRIRIAFSNGFDTGRLETMQPWNARPLGKLKTLADHVGHEVFRDARVLDVGSNAGYNAIFLTQSRNCRVVGIDNNRLNLRKAEALCEIAGVRPEFHIADAHEFRADPFDIVLHLGTLYHLQDPIKAMRTAAANLREGGHLFLETTGYEGADPLDARLIYGFGGDRTNYWALGIGAIRLILEDAGLRDVELVKTVQLGIYEGTGLNRLLLVARR